MTSVEIAAVAVTAVSIWLATRQHIAYWPTGIVSVVLYASIFYGARLYADAALQLVYLGLIAYGWWAWLHGGAGRRELPVSRTPARAWGPLFAAGGLVAVALGLFLRTATDASIPFWDAGTAAFSIVAQVMTARKWIENWIVWIAVDVVYVGMYVYKGLYPTAGLYAGFIVLAVIGYREWHRSLASA